MVAEHTLQRSADLTNRQQAVNNLRKSSIPEFLVGAFAFVGCEL
jgi:hypothetical protein